MNGTGFRARLGGCIRPRGASPLLALLGVALLAQGCDLGSRAPRSIVLITLDTTRWDHLGIYGNPDARTPFFDSVGRTGIVFEHAFVDVPSTLPSHTTMMTGAHSLRHGIRLNGEFSLPPTATTIAERLAAEGYATGAVISSGALRARHGLGAGFRRWDGTFREPFRGYDPALKLRTQRFEGGEQRRADEVTDVALEMLADPADPFFLWLHYVDPHLTHDPPPPWDRVPDLTAYAGEIAFTDREFGRVRRRLSELEREPVIAVLADHGEGLGEHYQDGHGMFLYESTTRIPFLLRVPEDGPRVERGMVLNADLAPSLEAAAGLKVSSWPDGVNQIDSPPSRDLLLLESLTPTRHGGTPVKASRAADSKYVHAPRPELYDLIQDPDELTNLFSDDSERVVELRDWMTDEVERLTSAKSGGDTHVDLTDAQIEALRSLGYAAVHGEKLPPDELSVDAIDPKDLIDVVLANRYVFDQRYAEARPRLDRFFARYAEFPGPGWEHIYARALYALVLVDASENGQLDAYQLLERAVELDPDYAEARATLEQMQSVGEGGGG